jgi:hypothetical protein
MEPGQTLGHEFMGIVEEVGTEVHEVKEGDRVVIPFNINCGQCWYCRHQLWSQCDRSNPKGEVGAAFGYTQLLGGYDGGQAEFVRLLSFSNVKHRALILTLASTGMRREALAQLKTSDIEYLEQYQLYKIKIYRKTQSEQICFTTPEAAKEIQQYLKIRDSLRQDNSLFQYDNAVSVSVVLRKLVIKAKVGNVHHEAEGDRHGQFRDSIPAAHGLRKFCITQMARAKVDTEVAKLLTGHSIGVRSRYLNYTDEDLLQEYSKAIDYLTINEENRLRKKVEVLKAKRDEIEMLKGQVQQKDDRLSVIEKQMQSLVSTLSKLTEQGQVNAVAQTLYSSGILKEGKSAPNQ